MTTPVNPARRSPVIWYVGLAVVVLLGIVAVIAARGSDDVSDEVKSEQTSPVTTEVGSGVKALPTFEDSGDDAAQGKTIPTVSGQTLAGKPITIGPDGKAKLILFVAHWCPHCQREVPRIVEHLKTSPLPDDVELLTVSTSVDEARGNYPPEAWLESVGWKAPVLADSADSAAARAYGLSSFPYFVVADADGKVVHRTSGEISVEEFDQLVEAARTGQAPT